MKTKIIDTTKNIAISDKELSLKENIKAFETISDNRNSVIKLYDSSQEDYKLILSWKGVHRWKIDHPIELNKIHRQRYATKQECLYFLKKIYYRKDITKEDDFFDVPVKHFTLDEMIEFKKEDEMMLRGQDPDLLKPTPTPSQKLETHEVSKSNISQKKKSKPSIILGDISVPKEEPRAKSTSSKGIIRKKQSTPASPLKQFKASAAQLKKEKEQPKATKTSTKPVAKDTKPPKLKPTKTDSASFLSLEENTSPATEKTAKAITTSKASKKKTTDNKTNPKTPEKKPPTKPKTAKRKTLHQLGAPLSKDKKIVTKNATKKDAKKPSDEDSFFSI